MPLSCSVSMFFCICYYCTFNLQPASYVYLLFFSITKLATNKNIVLLITQITFNSSSLAPQTYAVDCNDATQARRCSGFGMAGWEGDCQQACESPQLIFVGSVHCCRQLSSMLPDRERFPAASNIWPFFKTGWNFKSNTGQKNVTSESSLVVC